MEAPEALSVALRADMLGTWLPLALADIRRALSGYRDDPIETIRRWGLDALADDLANAQTDATLDSLAALQRQTKQET